MTEEERDPDRQTGHDSAAREAAADAEQSDPESAPASDPPPGQSGDDAKTHDV